MLPSGGKRLRSNWASSAAVVASVAGVEVVSKSSQDSARSKLRRLC